MTRRLVLFVLALLCALATVSPAAAATCPTAHAPQCFTVNVPLDRSGAHPGTVALPVVRYAASTQPALATLVVLVGGPGQAALPFVEDFHEIFGGLLGRYDLVVFDERGTGSAGALRCASLDSGDGNPGTCAAELGPTRSLYTTHEAVADLEAVRTSPGVHAARLAIFGVSYGTRVARAYAATYPSHVDRLVLDSAVPLNGPDPLLRGTIKALPRVLGAICARSACRGVTGTAYLDVVALAHKLNKRALRGYAVDPFGHRHRAAIGPGALLSLLSTSDLDPGLRALVPSAVRAARLGDAAPMLRLLVGDGVEADDPPEAESAALFAATTCEEDFFPWSRAPATTAVREASGRLALAVAAAQLTPFTPSTVYKASFMSLCAPWPVSPVAPAIANGALSGVPTLILSGQEDLRTPLEGATLLATGIAGAQVVQVANTGHSVLGTSPDNCPIANVTRFFASMPVSNCLSSKPLVPIAPLPPRSLSHTPRAGGVGGARGRVAGAVELTIEDAIEQAVIGLAANISNTPGLRGGHYVLGNRTIDLRRAVYVPGVTVSGRLRQSPGGRVTGTLNVTAGGGLSGKLALSRHRLTGKLGHRHVHTRASADIAGARGGDRFDLLVRALARVRDQPWLPLR